jgi:uncharacterized protein
MALTLSRLRVIVIATILSIPPLAAEGRRLEVLFLGDDRGHKPIERYRVLKQALGPQGFNLTFVEDLNRITLENLALYDALIVYANHESDKVPGAIIPWVRDGGALVALHSACGNFHPSKEWFDLVGGRFASHEGHVFSPKTVDGNHPVTNGLPALKCWDETYVHRDLTNDRHLLQVREPINKGETKDEPWTWTRNEGKGRVFYTASGHDLRCWNESAYQELVRRGILWAVGDAKAAAFSKYQLPELKVEVPQVENRAHPDIPMMPLQKPLSPQDSAKHAQVPVETRLVLFASEPMVRNPIAIDWDERGRAWVVESFGYPNNVPEEPGSGEDRIKILEDTDGDGSADRMTVFAEGLRHCTATVFANGGVIATDGRDLVFLKDENGDGKADVRKVMATGLNISDTHASTSQLQYGLDNWIHATVGYSGADMTVGGRGHRFGSSVFRFRPDLSELEFIQATTNNTWGLGFTDEGDLMGSTANNHPSWLVGIPARAYEGSGIEPPKTPRADSSTTIYPNTRDITQVDQIDRFTAAAGHFFLTDEAMARRFGSDTALICEPTGHLVALGKVKPKGALLATGLRGNNLYASADAWSAPVAARVGPDGAVWVADWYTPIVQHNVVFRFWNPARGYDQPHSPYHTGAKGPGKGNAYETPLRDRDHGRIWRIVPANGALRAMTGLDPAKPETLLAGLESPSQLIRLHAQRLIIERGGNDLAKPLASLVGRNAAPSGMDRPLAAVHAVWALEGLGRMADARDVLPGNLTDAHPLVRRHLMMALGPNDPAVIAALPKLLDAGMPPRELLHVLTIAARTAPNQPVAAALWKLAADNNIEEILRDGLRLCMRRQSLALLSIDLAGYDSNNWRGKELIEVIKRVAAGPHRESLGAIAANAPPELKAAITGVIESAPAVEAIAVPLPAHLEKGREVYLKTCVECHQPKGEGVPDTFPPLAGSEWVKGDADTMLRILLGGLAGPVEVNGKPYNGVMPGHSHATDAELAAVASYARHAFGGLEEKPVDPSRVKALRPQVEARKYMPWTVGELEKANGR